MGSSKMMKGKKKNEIPAVVMKVEKFALAGKQYTYDELVKIIARNEDLERDNQELRLFLDREKTTSQHYKEQQIAVRKILEEERTHTKELMQRIKSAAFCLGINPS